MITTQVDSVYHYICKNHSFYQKKFTKPDIGIKEEFEHSLSFGRNRKRNSVLDRHSVRVNVHALLCLNFIYFEESFKFVNGLNMSFIG